MAMSFSELKERYKLLPIWARLSIGLVLGLIPSVYMFTDEGDELQQKLVQAQEQASVSHAKFDEAVHKKANLPHLEEQMAYTEEQLAKAKLNLPDHVIIEDVLQKAATIAKKTGVQLSSFNPGADQLHQVPYPYVEQPIATEILGKFGEVATFLDQMVHLDGTIFVRRIELVRQQGADDQKAKIELDPAKKNLFEAAENERRNLQVKGKFDIILYRSLTAKEQQNAAPAPVPAAGKGGKKPDGSDAAEGKPATTQAPT